MLPSIWDINFSASVVNPNMTIDFSKDAVGWEGNCCMIIKQNGNTIHLFPDDLPWLKDRIFEMMEFMAKDGFVWNGTDAYSTNS